MVGDILILGTLSVLNRFLKVVERPGDFSEVISVIVLICCGATVGENGLIIFSFLATVAVVVSTELACFIGIMIGNCSAFFSKAIFFLSSTSLLPLNLSAKLATLFNCSSNTSTYSLSTLDSNMIFFSVVAVVVLGGGVGVGVTE